MTLSRQVRAMASMGAVLLALLLPAAPALAQNQQQAAQLAVRIQELEEQIRLLTGQVEGLQFQLTQMQTLIERMGQDNEFRFQQLEGGGVAPPPGDQGALPPGQAPGERLPQDPITTAGLPAPGALEQGDDLGMPGDVPMHSDLGDSADPLVNGGSGQASLGTLDLSLGGAGGASDGNAVAQYQAGYEAIVRGDYAFAEDQFQQFIQLYPDDPSAPDATNWLGEALIQRGAYDDAALVLAEGYQKYENSARAPDLMLKLGIALFGAGEQEVACRTFVTLERRFTGLSPAFVQRLGDEKARAQCPA